MGKKKKDIYLKPGKKQFFRGDFLQGILGGLFPLFFLKKGGNFESYF